jgi:hypothetical protein
VPGCVGRGLVRAPAVEVADVFLNSLGQSAIIEDYEVIE